MARHFPIDELASHPSYADALRLGEVLPGEEFVIFDPDNDTLQIVVPTTSYQTKPEKQWFRKLGIFLFIVDTEGNSVDLRAAGVHHTKMASGQAPSASVPPINRLEGSMPHSSSKTTQTRSTNLSRHILAL